jgi:carboxymethylenebutenolidase
MGSLGHKTTVCDTEAMMQYVDARPQADAKRIGAVGYCMSGPFVVWAGGAFADRLRCIASIYGANMVNDKPTSPHRMVNKLKGEAYFACAEIDKWASKEQVAQLQAALQDAGVKHRVEWYPGAEHGFAFPQRACYDKPSAERHWVRLFDLFERNLRRAV